MELLKSIPKPNQIMETNTKAISVSGIVYWVLKNNEWYILLHDTNIIVTLTPP